MKLKPYIFAIVLMGWALACSSVASAQEGRMQDNEPPVVKETPRNEPDPVLSSESESRNSKTTIPTPVKETPRDSVQVKITKPTTKTAEKEEKEEDPLSFNFMYYIIGKFKLSDIIE